MTQPAQSHPLDRAFKGLVILEEFRPEQATSPWIASASLRHTAHPNEEIGLEDLELHLFESGSVKIKTHLEKGGKLQIKQIWKNANHTVYVRVAVVPLVEV